MRSLFLCILLVALLAGCGRGEQTAGSAPQARPSILLVTLDTTRADAIGPDAKDVETPAFGAVAARGRRFRQAYAAVPETLPSHSSMLTGLYPAGHGVHENGRTLQTNVPVLAEQLQRAGYQTSAFVSSFVLARQFGLARGFDLYDDRLPTDAEERLASATTDAVIAALQRTSTQPRFVWVHYYDPHAPYAAPEPYRSKYAQHPYLGEIAYMDSQLGRLIDAFRARAGADAAIVIAGDHGEGLGEHGEETHGTLLYQSTMHVPLVIEGPGVTQGTSDVPVSARRIYDTILDWAGLPSLHSLRDPAKEGEEAVLGEGMKPFLEYGWQPQVMVVDGRLKAIEAGPIETYDLSVDAQEARNLGAGVSLPPRMRKALDDYPLPSPEQARAGEELDAESRSRLASLGYISGGVAPVVRKGAPRPADMTALLPLIERASGLFSSGKYAEAIPVLDQIHAKDPYNLDAVLRLAVSHSSLGHEAKADALFDEARAIAPQSPDVPIYLALHYARTKDWTRAVPLLEHAMASGQDRLAVLETLADLRRRQGRPQDAVALLEKAYARRTPSAQDLVDLGALAMEAGNTAAAIAAFERARAQQGTAFAHDLELGVLYMDARRYQDAAAALDRVPSSNPAYPMALFKRAQVSVLLHEPDSAARIALAKKRADAITRPLIEREKLFK
ncbi:MAG TPA: sulfatase-like hydrolase/transferase [Gemmatimonadaceae bacterium]